MISATELKRHPFAVVTYMTYIVLWILFVSGVYSIEAKWEGQGGIRCATGVMVTFFMMLALSALFLVSSLLFTFFTRDKKFFGYLTLGVLLPVIIVLLWQSVR
ncbi:hypothetical protein [Dyadobacter luteus]|nr:hypothetical protein [Dyadobacter luteus]